MGLGTVVRQSVSHSQTARARIGDRQLLDLDVRRPLSKRGTLKLQRGSNQPVVGARCHSNAAAREKGGSAPSLVPVVKRSVAPYHWAGGTIPALDHLLVRLLINRPWELEPRHLGLGLFWAPATRVGPPAAYQGSVFSFRVGVQSSQVTFIVRLQFFAGWPSTVSRASKVSQAGRERERSRDRDNGSLHGLIDCYQRANVHRSSRPASQAHGPRSLCLDPTTRTMKLRADDRLTSPTDLTDGPTDLPRWTESLQMINLNLNLNLNLVATLQLEAVCNQSAARPARPSGLKQKASHGRCSSTLE